jgi:beta-lactamase regulating signal transducer with metallopeptidase domain
MIAAALELHSAVPVMVAQVLNGVLGGAAVAMLAALILRLAPKANSGTRFAVWFVVLVAIAALPFVAVRSTSGERWTHPVSDGGRPGLRLPAVWAEGFFVFWAVMAFAGLARIAVGLWRVHQLRASCVPVDAARLELDGELQQAFGVKGIAVLCASDQVRVPAAVGFFRPAVVVPE